MSLESKIWNQIVGIKDIIKFDINKSIFFS